MSRARVAVMQVVSEQLTVTEAAAQYGYSRRHLHRLLARDRTDGLDAVEPRSRRPKRNPAATTDEMRARVIELRLQLTREGALANDHDHHIEPEKTYWRNQNKEPGRWPSS